MAMYILEAFIKLGGINAGLPAEFRQMKLVVECLLYLLAVLFSSIYQQAFMGVLVAEPGTETSLTRGSWSDNSDRCPSAALKSGCMGLLIWSARILNLN